MIQIFSDGGSRGNPGNAASAYAIFQDSNLIKKDSLFLGKTTNNVAEYNGVVIGLKGLLALEEIDLKKEIIFNLDSELVVKQLSGVYKIKDTNLIQLASMVKRIINENNLNIKFNHVPRAQNALADKLVNEKLDDSSRL